MKEEKHLEIHGGLREDIEMRTYLHGLMYYEKKLKLQFRVRDLDLPERYYEKKLKLRFRVRDLDLPERRNRYTSSREEDVATNMCLTTIMIE